MLLRLVFALTLLASSFAHAAPIDVPYRQQNWSESRGGSCVHCAVIVLLCHAGQPALARAWFYAHNGGETSDSAHEKLRAANIPFAYTDRKDDIGFLEWAINQNGLPCGVAVNDRSHCVVLVELTPEVATLIDPNNPYTNYTVPRGRFIANWIQSGSWAFCFTINSVSPRSEATP